MTNLDDATRMAKERMSLHNEDFVIVSPAQLNLTRTGQPVHSFSDSFGIAALGCAILAFFFSVHWYGVARVLGL